MPSLTNTSDYSLTEAQKAQFLEHGFVKIEKCFTKAQAAEFTSTMWTRLGLDPDDKSTWVEERVHMPHHTGVLVSEFAPKAWGAMCELLGGEERISDDMRGWNDGFIVNLGKEEFDPNSEVKFRELNGWHNDGDFFIHFLDSPEQALLVIPLWSDILPKAGGTAICTDGIKHIAKLLYDHPEGTTPWMVSTHDPNHTSLIRPTYWNDLAKDPSRTREETFHEMTGEIGDVVLMHPLMLHSASSNLLRHARVITNPPVSLKEPFCFDRENKDDYSLVELKTLRDLGMPEGLKGWKIEGPRRGWVPERLKRMEEMKRQEMERLKAIEVASS